MNFLGFMVQSAGISVSGGIPLGPLEAAVGGNIAYGGAYIATNFQTKGVSRKLYKFGWSTNMNCVGETSCFTASPIQLSDDEIKGLPISLSGCKAVIEFTGNFTGNCVAVKTDFSIYSATGSLYQNNQAPIFTISRLINLNGLIKGTCKIIGTFEPVVVNPKKNNNQSEDGLYNLCFGRTPPKPAVKGTRTINDFNWSYHK